MASKEDISDQLALTQKLNAAVTQMSAVMSRIETSFSNQISSVEKLTAAMEKLAGVDLGKIDASKLKDVQKEAAATEKSVKSLTGRFSDLTTQFSKKFPHAMAAATGALTGMKQGFTNILSLGKGIGGFFLKTIGHLGSIATSILAIPFNIFGKLVGAAASASGGMSELMQAIENLRKEMGDLKGPGSKAVLDTTKTLVGFKDTGLSAWRVFGTVAERLEFVTKDAVAMGATFGMLRKEFVQNGGALLAFQKGLGASEEQMKSIGDRAITMGVPMTKVFMDMTKQTLALGKAFDIDQKLIGKDMSKAFQDVKHFGSVTVKEIAQASVYARKLGVELDKIVGTLDAFETFDSAAENAAKLSQAFGVNVDAFQLMEAQNPAEQMDMLRKSFRSAGVDASQFSRQQAKLLATTTGLDEATVRQAFSAKNYGVSLDDVKKKSAAAEKKTMTQTEAMSKLADSIERMVKAGPQLENSFWKMFLKGMSAGIQSSGEFRGIMMNIRRALQQVYMIGVQLGKLLPSLIPGLHDFLGGWKDLFTPQKWAGLYKGISGAAKHYLTGNDKESVPAMLNALKKTFLNFFSLQGPTGQKIANGFKDLLRFLSKLVSGLVPEISKGIASALEAVTKFIKDPKAALNAAKAGAGSSKAFAIEIFGPILNAFKQGYNILKPAVINMFSMLWDKIKKDYIENEEFKSKIRAMLPSILETLASVIFGPGLLRGLLSFGASKLGTAVAGSVASGVTKAIGDKLIDAAAKKLGLSVAEKTATTVAEGASGGLAQAGKIATIGSAATGLWSSILGFVTTVPTAAAATAAAAIGVSLAAVTAAGYAAWSAYKAVDIQEQAQKGFEKITIGAINASGPNVSIAMKEQAIKQQDDWIKAQQKAQDEKGIGTQFIDTMFGTKSSDLQNQLAKARRARQDLMDQVAKKNGTDAAVAAKKAADDAKKQRSSDFLGDVTLGNAAQKMGDLKALADKLKGPGFDFEKTISEVKKKFEGINFDIFDAKQSDQIDKVSSVMVSVAQFVTSLFDVSTKGAKLKSVKIDIPADVLSGISNLAVFVKNTATNILGSDGIGGIDIGKLTENFDSFSKIIDNIVKLSGMTNKLATTKITAIPDSVKTEIKNLTSTIMAISGDISTTLGQNIDAVTKNLDNLGTVFDSMKEAIDKIGSTSTSIKKNTLSVALSAVKDMVNKANEMNDALSDNSLNKIDVSAKLGKLASSMGLGSKGTYTIKSKDVNITLNLQVSMNVDEVEKIMIMRKSSIIRNRLNFATTGETAGQQGTPDIPEKYAPTLQDITKGSK